MITARVLITAMQVKARMYIHQVLFDGCHFLEFVQMEDNSIHLESAEKCSHPPHLDVPSYNSRKENKEA